jgi:hypothetical protein
MECFEALCGAKNFLRIRLSKSLKQSRGRLNRAFLVVPVLLRKSLKENPAMKRGRRIKRLEEHSRLFGVEERSKSLELSGLHVVR